MNENYQFKEKRLIICDPQLGINIEESFDPPLTLSEKGGKLEGQHHLYYPGTEKLESECFYLSGMLHGPSRFYSETGVCLSETWFYKDRKEGKSTRSYLSGELCSIERFKGGMMHGNQEYYYEDGTVKSTLPYQNGRLEGEVTLFWPSGKMKRQCTFKEGAPVGEDKMWDSTGELLEE